MKKVPIRRCIVTGESLPKKDLLRIVKTPEGQLLIDPSGKLNGHGAYIQKKRDLVFDNKAKKAFEIAFKMKIEPIFYEQLSEYLAK